MSLKLKLFITFLVLVIIGQAIALCACIIGSKISKALNNKALYHEINKCRQRENQLSTENLILHYEQGQVKIKTEFCESDYLTPDQKKTLKDILFDKKILVEPKVSFNESNCIRYEIQVQINNEKSKRSLYLEKCCNNGMRYEELIIPFTDKDYLNFVNLIEVNVLAKLDKDHKFYIDLLSVLQTLKEPIKK